jgi:hypothetical protein
MLEGFEQHQKDDQRWFVCAVLLGQEMLSRVGVDNSRSVGVRFRCQGEVPHASNAGAEYQGSGTTTGLLPKLDSPTGFSWETESLHLRRQRYARGAHTR